MRNVLIVMLIFMAVTAVPQADMIRNVTATASSEQVQVSKDYTNSWGGQYINGRAFQVAGWTQTVDNVVYYREGQGFYEHLGYHNNETYDIGYSNPDENLGTMWLTAAGTIPGNQWITFVLTADPNGMDLASIKVWNFNQASPENDWDKLEAGVQEMNIELRDSAGTLITTVNPTTNIVLAKAPGLADVDFGQVIDIATDYNGGTPVPGVVSVTFDIVSNYGDFFGQVGLSEVKFYDDLNTVQPYAGLNKRALLVDTVGEGDPNFYEVQVTLDDAAVSGGTGPIDTTWAWYSPIYDVDPNLPQPSFDPSLVNPTVTFYAAGEYVFRLDAYDNGQGVLVSSGNVTVRIYNPDYTGLIAHWKFDEGSGSTAADELNRNNITSVGDTDGPVWVTPGVDGTGAALQFLGQVDGVITQPNGNYDAISVAEGDFVDLDLMAISLWFKLNPEEVGDDRNLQHQSMGLVDRSAWKAHINGDRLYCSFNVSPTGAEYANTPNGLGVWDIYGNKGVTNINDGQWHHFVLTYDGFYANMYVDGRLDAQRITYPGIVTGGLGGPLMLGARNWAGAEAWVFDGLMDDVRVYDRPLDQAEVADMYEEVTGHAPCVAPLDGDLNGDCDVDIADILVLAQNWLL